MPGADPPNLHSLETLRGLVTRLREGIYVTNRAGDILDTAYALERSDDDAVYVGHSAATS
jgi:hypothetical protein